MTPYERLVFPVIRPDDPDAADKGEWMVRTLGVGGFMLLTSDSVRASRLTRELLRRSPWPLLFSVDAEAGPAERQRDYPLLPSAAAMGAAGDLRLAFEAGRATARTALAAGAGWIYAPVVDVESEPENPIIGLRSFGDDPREVARLALAWIRGCQSAGALACAKHFPGHGDTSVDSHLALATVRAGKALLARRDLAPFRAACRAGVASVMVGHLAVPALDRSGLPATLSPKIIEGILRRQWRYDGLIVTDAIVMKALDRWGPEETAIRCLSAGNDILLFPADPAPTVEGIRRGLAEGRLSEARLAESLRRLDAAIAKVRIPKSPGRRLALGPLIDRISRRAATILRGRPRLARGERVAIHHASLDGKPPDLSPLREALGRRGILSTTDLSDRLSRPLVVLSGHVRAYQGAMGLPPKASRQARKLLARPGAVLVVLTVESAARKLSSARAVVCAYGSLPAQQKAAAELITA